MEPATAVGRLRRTEAIQRLLDLLRAELRADACVLFTFGDGVSTVRALAGDARMLAEVIRNELTERRRCRSAGR
jgi:hypothetical protein